MTSLIDCKTTTGLSTISNSSWRYFVNGRIASVINSFSSFYDRVIQLSPKKEESHALLSQIECSEKYIYGQDLENLKSENDSDASLYLMNGNLNYSYDIQLEFRTLHKIMNRESRIIGVVYNPYLSVLFKLAHKFKLIKGNCPDVFLTRASLKAIAKLSDFEIVRTRNCVSFPFRLFGFGIIFDEFFRSLPLINVFSAASVYVFRPIKKISERKKISIVIPARNEAGNIENALERIPKLNADVEIIFIEGNSTDTTWDEIKRVQKVWSNRYNILIDQQTGKGKANAVEKGFDIATGDILTILDADLTMPPEKLPYFLDSYLKGHGDFINGSRLIYPMEGSAMRTLNKFGNIFFSKALSFVLQTRLTDSLCGTKLFSRRTHKRFLAWREKFGRHDPFGDYDMIFPACVLCLGVQDVPIRYLDRSYGQTNISRFTDGLRLLKMTLLAFFKIRIK